MKRRLRTFYILNEKGIPEACPSLKRWGRWFQTADRKIARTDIGETFVSTVFLGLDHNFTGDGPAILWETMVFRNGEGGLMKRCAGSREQAEAMHAEVVAIVRQQAAK